MHYQLKQIPSEREIKKILRKIVFGSHLYCPKCKSRKVVKYQERYRCLGCKSRFSLLSHTWLKAMKLDLRTFWLILWCWLHLVSIQQTMKLCNLSQKAVIYWFDKFRENLPKPYDEQVTLSGVIQMDEAYFGHFSKKYCLLMAKQIERSYLIPRLLSKGQDPNRLDVIRFLKDFIEPGATLCTDGSSIYECIDNYWTVTHIIDNHGNFEFKHTSQIEGTFGNLRVFIQRMYYHISGDKLGSVVSEFCLRFNHPEIFKNPRSFLEITLRPVTFG